MTHSGKRVVEDATVRWISQAWRSPDDTVSTDTPPVLFIPIPFDHAVSHRPGTRFGPAAILEALDGCSLYCTDKRTDLVNLDLRKRDDVDVSNNIHDTYREVARVCADLPADVTPVFLGGDHSLTDPILRGLKRRRPTDEIGLIVFDAHFDSRVPIPGKEHSGHWMHTVSDVFDHHHSVQIGIDAPIYSADYMKKAEDSGVMVLTPWQIRRQGWAATLETVLDHAVLTTDSVHVSIDIDCLSVASAPGTSVPNPMGLLPWDVADALFEIASRASAISLDLVEVSPPLDPQGVTSRTAAHLILNFLAGRAKAQEASRKSSDHLMAMNQL